MSTDTVDDLHAAEEYGERLRVAVQRVLEEGVIIHRYGGDACNNKECSEAVATLVALSAEPFIRPDLRGRCLRRRLRWLPPAGVALRVVQRGRPVLRVRQPQPLRRHGGRLRVTSGPRIRNGARDGEHFRSPTSKGATGMALYQITARLLVNVDDAQWPEHQDAVVTDGLNETFRGTHGFVADWAYDENPTSPAERLIIRRDDLALDDYEEGAFLLAPNGG